jgi:aryl-alcohol dehydrogenase-like predicted oxidoreductase
VFVSTISPIWYKTIGASDTLISSVGLGCASAWGQSWFDENTAIKIVRRAIELGVTAFDTGPSYSNGNAEPRLGKAIQGVEVDKLLISTKAGTHIGANGKLFHDMGPEAILSSVERSRQQLGLDTIPLLYLHGPRKNELNNQLFDTLVELRHRGWVRMLGFSSADIEVLETAESLPVFEVVMLEYNVLRSNREHLIAELAQSGKFVVAGKAMANRLYAPTFLWPKSRADVWYLLRALKNYRRDIFRAWKRPSLGGCSGWTEAQIALAFVLSDNNIGTAMFGTTNLQHLEENVAACGIDLSYSIIEKIRSL